MLLRWFVTFVLLFSAFAGNAAGNTTADTSFDGGNMLRPLPGDVVMGNANAPVTMIEYHSVTCPHCAYYNANVLPKIMERYVNKGQILYIVREYPVDEQSFNASLIMRCMPKPKVHAFMSVLLANQKEWWGRKQYMDIFKTYASLGGVDINNLIPCTNDPKVREDVFQDKLNAIKILNVVNIPTFFINGKKYEGARPWDYWEGVLSDAIHDASAIARAKTKRIDEEQPPVVAEPPVITERPSDAEPPVTEPGDASPPSSDAMAMSVTPAMFIAPDLPDYFNAGLYYIRGGGRRGGGNPGQNRGGGGYNSGRRDNFESNRGTGGRSPGNFSERRNEERRNAGKRKKPSGGQLSDGGANRLKENQGGRGLNQADRANVNANNTNIHIEANDDNDFVESLVPAIVGGAVGGAIVAGASQNDNTQQGDGDSNGND